MLTRLQKQAEYWREGANPVIESLRMVGVNTKPTTLLKRHPVYCGLWVADMRAHLHHLGLGIKEAFGSILYAGRLYNALEAEGLIADDMKWHDMELFFGAQGGRDNFFGQAPSNVKDHHKQICLEMGFSATGSRVTRANYKLPRRGPAL